MSDGADNITSTLLPIRDLKIASKISKRRQTKLMDLPVEMLKRIVEYAILPSDPHVHTRQGLLDLRLVYSTFNAMVLPALLHNLTCTHSGPVPVGLQAIPWREQLAFEHALRLARQHKLQTRTRAITVHFSDVALCSHRFLVELLTSFPVLQKLTLVARDGSRRPWEADLYQGVPPTHLQLRSLEISSYTHQHWGRIVVHLAPLCPNLRHVRVEARQLGLDYGIVPPGSPPVAVEALTVCTVLSSYGYNSFLFNCLRTSLLRPRILSIYPLGCSTLFQRSPGGRDLFCTDSQLEDEVSHISDYLRASPVTARLASVRLLPPTWRGAEEQQALLLLRILQQKIQSETDWDVEIGRETLEGALQMR